jgi:hypothetical protein
VLQYVDKSLATPGGSDGFGDQLASPMQSWTLYEYRFPANIEDLKSIAQ